MLNRIMHPVSRRERLPFLLFILTGSGFTLPAFASDFYSGHNVLTHLIWSIHFADQFWSGDLYPRWLMNMNEGLGSPAFFFYFPLPYLFTSLFHAPFLKLGSQGWQELGLSCATAFTLSGMTCYIWLRAKFGRKAAAVGALFYMLLPYHLLIDLYYRFAFTEFWTFVFMPLCLFFADRVQRKARFAVAGFAVSYALLFLTHLPTVLIFTPALLCYGMVIGKPGQRIVPILRLSCALLLGAGLSAFYWLPAVFTQSNVSFESMSQGEFYFENNFIFSFLENGTKKLESVSYHSFVSFSTLFTMAVCLISWLSARQRSAGTSSGNFWIVICLVSTYMMLDVSSWIWHLLPLLPRIQFPYRFNVLLAVGGTALVASAVESIPQGAKSMTGKLWVVAAAAFFISQILISGITVSGRASGQWDLETLGIIERELSMSPEVTEYAPRWANAKLFPITSGSGLLKDVRRVRIVRGKGDASIVSWGPGRIVLQANGTTPLLLTVRHLYYPAWKAHAETSGVPLSVFPSTEEGFIGIHVPEGSQRVELTLENGSEESMGLVLSVMSSGALIALMGCACIRDTGAIKQ